MAAGRPSSFSLMKKNQKIKSAERLLCRTGLCPANHAKPGLQTVAPLRHALGPPFCNICYALQPHSPALFYQISPEASLLTAYTNTLRLLIRKRILTPPQSLGSGRVITIIRPTATRCLLISVTRLEPSDGEFSPKSTQFYSII